MRWPKFWLRRRRNRDEAARRARLLAERMLEQERFRLNEARIIADSLAEVRNRNNFGESMIELFRGSR